MNYFIVGDVHACYYTLRCLLRYWNSKTERLVFVGDLIDRGLHGALVLRYCKQLHEKHPNTLFLQGNHEAEMISHFTQGPNHNWLRQGGQQSVQHFAQHKLHIPTYVAWMQQMPLVHKHAHICISHAGISHTPKPFDPENMAGVLWNRQPLKKMPQLQIHGHTPLKRYAAKYHCPTHSWNIDTGAAYGYGLSGLKVTAAAKVQALIHVNTHAQDVN